MSARGRTYRVFAWVLASFLFIVGALFLVGCGKEEKAAGTPSAKATTAPAAKATPIPRLQSEEFKRLPQKIQDAWTKWHPDNLKRPDPYKPVYGGILRRGGGLTWRNYIKANQPSGYTMWNYISTGLVKPLLNWGDDIVNLQPEPDVAESWSSNKDGTEWTFKIRDNVYFQNLPPVNGRKLTANDVKWWWDTVRKDAYFAGEMAEITSVEAPDDRTVVVKSSKPFPDIINMLMYPNMVIFPKECWADEKNCMENIPVGLGAFQMKEKTEQRALLVRNPRYHLKDFAGNPLPYLDGIEVISIPDAAARDAAWRTGQLDQFLSRGGGSTLADTFVKENPGVRVEMDGAAQSAYLSGQAVMFNFKNQGPWQDKRVRQALSMAINRERVCAIANADMCVVQFPVHFTELGRQFEFTWTDLPATMKYNPQKAKELLAQAGYEKGFTLEIETDLTLDNIWLEVFKDWEAIGVKADQKKQPDLYLRASTRVFPAAQGTSSTPIGTRPKVFSWAMLNSEAPGNFGSYKNADMDRLTEDWRYAVDPQQRRQLSQQIFDLVADQLPRIEVWDFARFELSQPWLFNVACSSDMACANQGVRTFYKAWIDPSAGLPAARKFEPRSAP